MTHKFHKELLAEIERFLKTHGMGHTYFGKKAANNSDAVQRLRDGGTITGKTEQKLRDFMASYAKAAA